MSVLETRGGVPHVLRATISAAGRDHQFPFTSKYLMFKTGLKAVKMYFTQANFDADANYILENEWEGPVEASRVWMKGDGGDADIVLIAFQRRG